jgi:hypothetical protein
MPRSTLEHALNERSSARIQCFPAISSPNASGVTSLVLQPTSGVVALESTITGGIDGTANGKQHMLFRETADSCEL